MRKLSLPSSKSRLLTGGNPQIAKADGDTPVQEYIAAVEGWKRDVCAGLDELISQAVPGVHKAVRWNSPMYGIKGQGWFMSFHVFTKYVKVTFFKGTSLIPVPPGGNAQDARWIDVTETIYDEPRLIEWVKQAASTPGWGKS
jgi:hypothetical protein